MKYSLGISNFLEEISSLSYSIIFLCVFALITEEGFLISPCYSLELYVQAGISFIFSFAFCFSSFTAICREFQSNNKSGLVFYCYNSQTILDKPVIGFFSPRQATPTELLPNLDTQLT